MYDFGPTSLQQAVDAAQQSKHHESFDYPRLRELAEQAKPVIRRIEAKCAVNEVLRNAIIGSPIRQQFVGY